MAIQNYKPKINPRNRMYADKIRSLVDKYSIVGVVDVTGLPAPQFQRIRASLKGKAEVLIVKRNIIEIVLNELEDKFKGISKLCEKVSGIVGLIFTNDNPFTLFKFIKKNKSSAPAKPGSIAPNDIIVPAGPTNFAPGPIIGELGALKIKAGINAGKVEIKEDCLVAKEGDVISDKLAGILSRLGIEPMEVGLNIKAVYEAGIIYDKGVLDVDEEKILNDIKSEASRAAALAYGLGYYTKENINLFLSKAGMDSLSLGIGLEYPVAETIKSLIMKAQSSMVGLSSKLPEDIRPAGLNVMSEPVAETSSNEGSANEEPKEDKKEEEAAASLGSFF